MGNDAVIPPCTLHQVVTPDAERRLRQAFALVLQAAARSTVSVPGAGDAAAGATKADRRDTHSGSDVSSQ